ncbi:LysM peptidoglycan-binding domain-containing protein [Microbacterium sp. cx-59]|uniref:LysM peptidoglycan-binding domain-containing protein n=1 Tax=Microbacterium sp. cx-59 TaxID=2891207 RepID=UPI001E4AD0B1|nr:LysM peptidoglycan-binding domain-containing protein [Microbacterium sp. cx-59]MCC4907622.1 LysM peptidoglycan-binding domain-containing protein [Microbacterium sp. cx-59]
MSSHALVRPRTAALGLSALAGGVALALHPAIGHAAEPRTLASHDARPLPTALPASVAPPATHTVVSGDTVSGVAGRYGLRTADVLAWSGLGWDSVLHPGDLLQLQAPVSAPAPAPPSATAAHTVQAGDTISGIAARNGTTAQAVLAANGLTWDSIIYPGQTIALPTAAAPSAPAAAAAPAPAAAAPVLELDAEQIANAQLIIRIGRELGVSDRGIVIALGTAMQESWLRNLDWGDRDSEGLFQQRPASGWGTADQVRDPDRATRAFFGGAGDPNGTLTRGLLDIPGWESMSYADAAQSVQISAYPDRYAQWEQPATTWLSVLG